MMTDGIERTLSGWEELLDSAGAEPVIEAELKASKR